MSRPHCSDCTHWTSESGKWGRCELKHSRPFVRTYEDGFKQTLWTSEYSYRSYNCKKFESIMGQVNPQEPINYHIENDGTYDPREEIRAEVRK